MADNVAITPGSGATAAADDIGGVLFQRVKVAVGADGVNDGDVSSVNPMPVAGYGELVEAIEALRMAVQALTRSGLGQSLPDTSGRIRVLLDAITASLTLATITTVGTVSTVTGVTTVSTVTNQSQIGGTVANDHIPALLHLQADNLRRNIAVT